jgi:radical SAM superfamily enzyme YgiQ (UPF0313 family)
MSNPDGTNQVEAKIFRPLGRDVKALLVWPKIPDSFWSFRGIMGIVPQKTVMPPLGLITVAALCPDHWKLRLIDCAIDRLRESDLLWADLVMVSAMHVQKDDVAEVLAWARRLNKRTIIGGPYASSQPEVLLRLADHVVVGEPDEVFLQIAREIEDGSAKRLYEVQVKPDVTHTPVPRFDLLKHSRYVSMPIQFSRGCPYQCEFCDIITIYGRKPRTKAPQQLLAELAALYKLGWRREIFVVDDNFIGNQKRVLEFLRELLPWQAARDFPYAFYTEASIDLAQRPALVEAMVKANFFYVFVGIESPSAKSLVEAKKLQNLRGDALQSVRFLQKQGLWVTGGFIIGFDSDREDIFNGQTAFIEAAAIPWAMIGLLQAPPTTPLFDRMRREGRLLEESSATTNFQPPNFITRMPLNTLLSGYRKTLAALYDPDRFYARCMHSLEQWQPRSGQRPPRYQLGYQLGTVLRSLLQQGIQSAYRRAYWNFLLRLLRRWPLEPARLWLGFTILISGHHFIPYAAQVMKQLMDEVERIEAMEIPTATSRQLL